MLSERDHMELLKAEIALQDENDMLVRSFELLDGGPDGAADRVWLEHAKALEAARKPDRRRGVWLPAKLTMVVVVLVTVALGLWARSIGQGVTFGLFVFFGAPILLGIYLGGVAIVQWSRD